MNNNISIPTAVLLFTLFGGLLGLKFWFDDLALDFRGPDHLHTDAAHNLYIQIGNQLLKHDAAGSFLKRYDLIDFGIANSYGDFAFFNNGDILIRRGINDLSLLEKVKRYRRMTNKTTLAAPDEDSGLFRCNLESKKCVRFGDGSIDFNRTFHLFIDPQTENVYIADSSRHTLRLFDVNGVQIAIKGTGFLFPNQLSLIEGSLYLADTNHHRLVSLYPTTEKFAKEIDSHLILSNNPAVISPELQRHHSQTWPATFTRTQDLWWVNVMNNGMRDGDIYLFDNDWRLQSLLDLPENADPMDLVQFNGHVLISDLSLNRVYQFDQVGHRLQDFTSPGLQHTIADNATQQGFYKNLSRTALAAFILLFIGILLYALKQSRSKPT